MKLAFGAYSYLETKINFISTSGDVLGLAATKRDVTMHRYVSYLLVMVFELVPIMHTKYIYYTSR